LQFYLNVALRPRFLIASCDQQLAAEVDMATANDPDLRERRFRPAPSSGWEIAWGVLLIISGVLAMVLPGVAALATALLFAWVLVFGGGCEVAYAFQTRGQQGFGWKLASGILTVVLGVAILVVPLAGVASLALLIGGFIFAAGITRTALAFKLRPAPGWGWVLFDGVLSIVVALLIAIGWPENSFAFIGLLTGLWLIWAGVWRILLRQDNPG
jgi:uncharacterized membrane protein HdeD (DUF308 family)